MVNNCKAQVAEREADLISVAAEQQRRLKEWEQERQWVDAKMVQEKEDLTAKWDAERGRVSADAGWYC